MIAWHQAHMERRSCEHCQQTLLHHQCDQCCGTGYLWARDETGDVPMDCPTCGGSGEEFHCTNTACPGKRWYPLSRAERATWRSVQASVMREEKMGK